jgi:hypothetical protein
MGAIFCTLCGCNLALVGRVPRSMHTAAAGIAVAPGGQVRRPSLMRCLIVVCSNSANAPPDLEKQLAHVAWLVSMFCW